MSFCTRPIVPAISAVRHADDRDDFERERRVAEQHRVAANHVHAGRDHRRRVDERGDRRRAFHRVRQPDVQRQLRGLARGAEEQQQRGARQDRRARQRGASAGSAATAVATPWKSSVPNAAEQRQHAEDEPEVADAVDDEGLLAGVGGRLAS